MSAVHGDWQVVDTQQKKKEKLKLKHKENAIEQAARDAQLKQEREEKEAELRRMGLGFTITDVSTKEKKPKKHKPGHSKKQISGIYELEIPEDEPKKPKKPKTEGEKVKKIKEPKEPKDKSGKNLAQACDELDVAALRAQLKEVDAQLQKLAELLEGSFPKIRGFNKHEQGHLYRRIHSPLRTLQERNAPVFQLLKAWIGDRPISSDYVSFLIDLVADGSSQGVGVRILLSILARFHPQKIVAEGSYVASKVSVRTASWVFLQTMYADPDVALLLWVKHLLPILLEGEKENPEIVIYISCLFTYVRKKEHKLHVPMREDMLAVELGKFLVSRVVSEGKFTLMKDHYYELLDSAFITPKDPTALFQELLRLTSSDDEGVSTAAFDVLVYNLKTNVELFKIWKALYANHVVETNNLLVFIYSHYEQIQNSSLPPIIQEPYTYASDVSSGEEDSDEESQKAKGKKKINEIGAMIELNGKLIHKSQKRATPHARAKPISVKELTQLITRIQEVNAQLATTAAKKGGKSKGSSAVSGRVTRQSLEMSNATCTSLKDVMKKSKSGREGGRSKGGCLGVLVKGTVFLAGVAAIAGAALHYAYGPEFVEQLVKDAPQFYEQLLKEGPAAVERLFNEKLSQLSFK